MRIICLLLALFFWQAKLLSQCQSPIILQITSQSEIDSFASHYPGCSHWVGSLRIVGKDIISLSGLDQLQGLLGELQINNTSIISFYGLHNLVSVNRLAIIENDLITDLTGFDSLTYIGQSLWISGNAALVNLEGTNGILRIHHSLTIKENPSLQNFNGLNNLLYIGDEFWLTDNPSLQNFEGLNKLDTVKNFMLVDGNGILNFLGLDSLKHVGNKLAVANNPNLNSFEGLSGLKYTKYLIIGHNNSLSSLNGLGAIQEIENDIAIYNNPVLTSLSSFEVADVSGLHNLQITDNPLLSHCAVHWVCHYTQHFSGMIYGNAPGCQSGQEVRELCLVDTENPNAGNDLCVYPNPANDFIYTLSPQLKVKAYVTDITGAVVLQEASFSGQIDIAHLPPGTYVLHLYNSKTHLISKFAKN